jgi:hypothetical protein
MQHTHNIERAVHALARVKALSQPDLSADTLAAIAEGPLLENWHVTSDAGRPVLVGVVVENGVLQPTGHHKVCTSPLMALRAEDNVASTQSRFYRLGTPATDDTMVDTRKIALSRDVFAPMMDAENALVQGFLDKMQGFLDRAVQRADAV